MWTPWQVQQELPSVKVRAPNGKIYNGRISGRLNKYATVSIESLDNLKGGNKLRYNTRFTWAAVCNALNNDTALLA